MIWPLAETLPQEMLSLLGEEALAACQQNSCQAKSFLIPPTILPFLQGSYRCALSYMAYKNMLYN